MFECPGIVFLANDKTLIDIVYMIQPLSSYTDLEGGNDWPFFPLNRITKVTLLLSHHSCVTQ